MSKSINQRLDAIQAQLDVFADLLQISFLAVAVIVSDPKLAKMINDADPMAFEQLLNAYDKVAKEFLP